MIEQNEISSCPNYGNEEVGVHGEPVAKAPLVDPRIP